MIPKIAIQGDPTRGKEIIQILESLGGKNPHDFRGDCIQGYYSISNNIIIYFHNTKRVENTKLYTLEEFEKEFPFKVGDKVRHISSTCIIKEYGFMNNKPVYVVKSTELGILATIPVELLKPYKEMEERNITLTLDKAKEWYKKGGELREIALQAFTEEELINTEKELTKVDLPKTFEEFCNNCPIKIGEYYIDSCSFINKYESNESRNVEIDKNVCPSKQSAEAHLALIQLEQLRDCYRQGDIPDFTKETNKYCIVKINKRIDIVESFYTSFFLSFTKKEIAEEFFTNFKPLIKIVEDYI